MFHKPHRILRSWWESWSLLVPWSPEMAQPEHGARLPRTSPCSFGVSLDVSSADRMEINEVGGRHISPLLTHAMGSADQVLTEVFFPPADGRESRGEVASGRSHTRGSALVCGLGLVGRAGRDPVVDRVLRNLASYILAPTEPPEPHPLFSAGEAISWGANYSSEKGVAYSAPSGLLVQPCGLDESCASSNLGMRACGRFPSGPFDWTWMGHNRDLAPDQLSGRAVVFFRTTATTITTLFEATVVTVALPLVELQLLAADFSVQATVSCVGKAYGVAGPQPVAVCHLPKPAGTSESRVARHVAMRVTGPKTTALKRTMFA